MMISGKSKSRGPAGFRLRAAHALLIVAALLGMSPAQAVYRDTVAALSLAGVALPARAKPRAAPVRPPAAETKALPVVTAAGIGQTGYVHYWVITAPDGEEEIQVGIELSGGRIAWAFPELGVQVVPFFAEGEVDARGRRFQVRHLYGLRPFAGDAAMRTFREQVEHRVAYWIDNETAYCFSGTREREICLSCMGLVMQVLFPGKTPAYPGIPRDFPRTGGDLQYSTEDLLLYLTRLHLLPGEPARRQRIAVLGGPPALREELTRLSAQLADDRPAVADAAKPPLKRRVSARPPAPKPIVRRPAG
ncbi:MAG: hypothetical protein KIT13_03080 [Burkholderiales bacterium]|nr:hypothetical protein [Burkholderiales bacterium]